MIMLLKNRRFFSSACLLQLLVFIFCSNASANATNIEIVTENFPPLQSNDHGKKSGYVHQTMQEVIKIVNKTHPIHVSSYRFLPWKRALNRAVKVPNVLFYSLSRSPSREEQYQWLGEISIYRKALFKLKERPFTVSKIKDLKAKELILAVQNGGSDHIYFSGLGFKSNKYFQTYTSFQQGIKQLFRGRVDLIPLNILTAKRSTCKLGLDGSQLEMVIPLDDLSKPLWVVLSNGTDPALISEFKSALKELQENGIAEKYYKENMELWDKIPCD